MMNWKEIGFVLAVILIIGFAGTGLIGSLYSAHVTCKDPTLPFNICEKNLSPTHDFFDLPNLLLVIIILMVILTEVFFITIKKFTDLFDVDVDGFVPAKIICIIAALLDANGICFTYYLFVKHSDMFLSGLSFTGVIALIVIWFISNYYIGKKIDEPKIAKQKAANEEYLKRVKQKERAIKRRRRRSK